MTVSRGCWVLMCDLLIKVPLSTPSAKSCLFTPYGGKHGNGPAGTGAALDFHSSEIFTALRKSL